MLKEYPVKFNNQEIPFTKTWDESYNVVENVGSAEDGSDIIQIKRTDKLTVSVSTRVISAWANYYYAFSKTRELINVSIYDSDLESYVVRKMRMRDFHKAKVPKSEDLEVTMGLWDVSFTLIETEF